MKIRELENKMKGLPIFNLNDIRKVDPDFHRQQINYWKELGYLKSLVGGYYMLSDQTIDENLLFFLANKIYEPSYISLETALAYHSIIPESTLAVTSVSSRKTIKFESSWGVFSYRKIKPNLLFGYKLIETNRVVKIKIASIEKAVLDYLYLHSEIESLDDFATLRWNKTLLEPLNDSSVFRSYLKLFGKNALDDRASILLEYLNA